ncbi:MAG: class I SAM-dependent methyltransferase [Pseudomonadota bacterium]
MDKVERQYETYPYPARDPGEEASRLITGSPSDPVEIDHYLFGGKRDWSEPFRALVAGGGTGDGLIMLAQRLSDMGCPAEITYLDLSEASRAIAEARAARRGLTGIRFLTETLLEAPRYGPFDYIDCCGVLHHLPDPDAGFRALAEALAPEGGIGLMVYAPLGRAGVYPLQQAFGTLFAEDAPERQVALARAALDRLAPTHPFARNPLVGDHRDGEAGLYDLLLHARDRPYSVEELDAALSQAGLAGVSYVERGRYEPGRYLPSEPAFKTRLDALEPLARAGLAERLAGNMKTHILYASHAVRQPEAKAHPDAVPHLHRVDPGALARQIQAKGRFSLKAEGLDYTVTLPKAAAPILAGIDGRRPLGELVRAAGRDWLTAMGHWGPAARELIGFNMLHYSRGGRR